MLEGLYGHVVCWPNDAIRASVKEGNVGLRKSVFGAPGVNPVLGAELVVLVGATTFWSVGQDESLDRWPPQ